MMDPFSGIPLKGSSLIPEGQLYRMDESFLDNPFTGGRSSIPRPVIYFHQRLSTKHKWRKRHGRPRNAPRVRRTTVSTYRPDYDKLIASLGDENVHRA